MNNLEFAKNVKDVATNYKTLYVWGCFGAPMTASNKNRYSTESAYNRDPVRTQMIKSASADTFGFDCVCLIKGILWGWNGNKSRVYGGAVYKSNGVPDIDANQIIEVCSEVSNDFSKIEVGEIVWMKGHVGVYIGDGLVVECSPKWDNCVQITACNCTKSGYNRRTWTKHGKLPYITYDKIAPAVDPKKTVDQIAREVLDGKWYTGAARKSALTKAGYDYNAVQERVNELLSAKKTKSNIQIAQEVLDGKWGNGAARKSALKKAGYDYDTIQHTVNLLIVAKDVLNGRWGNGAERKKALVKAGYDYDEVQNMVNELLGN